jgi:hypothetical protein
MNYLKLIIPALVLIVGCSQKNNSNYFPIEKFEINNDLMEDSSIVYILYASAKTGDNKNNFEDNAKFLSTGDSYVQLVVHTGKGDTFNILTPVFDEFTSQDQGKEFYFRSIEDQMVRVLFIDHEALIDGKKINEAPLRNIEKVVRDPSFDKIADNKYKTTLGIIERK